MKEERLLKTLGDVDEKFIDEAAPTDYPESAEQPDYTEIIPRKEPFYMKILPIAACLAFVGVGITAGVLIKSTALNPASQTLPSSYPTCEWSSSVTEVSDAYRIPHWDELDINSQYTRFEWRGYAYDTAGAETSAENLGELLGETTASGVDEYTDEKRETTVSVYPITKVNEKAALAVRFGNSENYYVYYNRNYGPRTLGDFIDDLNLEENLEISDTATGTAVENLYLTTRAYSGIDTSKLMEILLSGRNVPTESMFDYNTFVEGDRFEAALEFAVDIPILGIENLSLEITKGGFVHTNAFFHTSTLFYLGKDKTDPFVQYVKENCPSKITWQSDEPLSVEISQKLDEFLTEGCRENFTDFLLCRNIIRFKEGKTLVSALDFDGSVYREPKTAREVEISAKFDEERSNLLNVTVTEIFADDNKGTQYKAIFERCADGKYRICTADFDGISEIFSSVKVNSHFVLEKDS